MTDPVQVVTHPVQAVGNGHTFSSSACRAGLEALRAALRRDNPGRDYEFRQLDSAPPAPRQVGPV